MKTMSDVSMDFKTTFESYANQINIQLQNSIGSCDYNVPVVYDAMKYSLNIGGKRIRPVLVMEFCRLCGGDTELCEPLCNAIEMIHTYSLIHDDLPCMDNDDMRRGKPSCHKAFGENYALLAGDGLLTQAFIEISKSKLAEMYPERALECIRVLSECAGVAGMIGGQVIDLDSEGKQVGIDILEKMDELKTGALIKAACIMGVICAGGNDSDINKASLYAEKIGKAFQIVDDILDVIADEKELGKPVGSDLKSNKSTYVTLLGLEKSKELALTLTNEALEAIESYESKSYFLTELAKSLANRRM